MLCLFALSMVLSAWALPPDEKKVTLDLKDVPMETFLNTVKQKAGINMLYNSQMFKGVEPVTVKATNEPWKELLDRVLSPKGMHFIKIELASMYFQSLHAYKGKTNCYISFRKS